MSAGLSGTGRIADDLYLMAHHDVTGKPFVQPRALGIALVGGLLAELMLGASISLRSDGAVLPGRSWPEDELARHVRDLIAAEHEPHPVWNWLLYLAGTAADDVAGRLRLSGYVTRVGRRVPWRPERWVPVDPDWAFSPLLRVRSALDPARPLSAHGAVLAGLAAACGLGFRLAQYAPSPCRRLDEALGHLNPRLQELVAQTQATVGSAVLFPAHLITPSFRNRRLSMSRTHSTIRPGTISRALARDRLGVPIVLFFVLAWVAPLTVAAGVIPTAYATTGLTGIPAAFLLVAVVLAVWATGYVAMTRHITNAGAFYAFIARGLGRPAGVAAALVALVAYSFLQVGLYGALGPAAAGQAAAHLGVHAPRWVWALATWALITGLGLARVDITDKVLGVLLTAEILVILAETIAGLAHPAGGQLSFATLSPAALTSAGTGAAGVLAVVAVLGFVGFEQAPVLAKEARHPRRTIPVATYLALGTIAVVYASAAWATGTHAGRSQVVAAAVAQGPGLLFRVGSGWLGQAAQWLFLTSLFAAAAAAGIGLVWGLVLRARRPQLYAAVGLGVHAVTGQIGPASRILP